MKIRVSSSLRRLTGSQAVVEDLPNAVTVSELIERLDGRYPGFKEHICEPDGRLKRFLRVFVNGADIRNLQGLATMVADADEMNIVPSMAGGSPTGLHSGTARRHFCSTRSTA